MVLPDSLSRKSKTYNLYLDKTLLYVKKSVRTQAHDRSNMSAESSSSTSKPPSSDKVSMTEVSEAKQVFDHWVLKCRTKKGRPVKLTDQRRAKINRALKDYTVEELKLAIDGVLRSPWHQGDNPRGRRYDDIELIVRDAQHIEMFIDHALDADEDPF